MDENVIISNMVIKEFQYTVSYILLLMILLMGE
jgi:hypothetical protein